jgi:hypothetical protein
MGLVSLPPMKDPRPQPRERMAVPLAGQTAPQYGGLLSLLDARTPALRNNGMVNRGYEPAAVIPNYYQALSGGRAPVGGVRPS